MSKTAKTVNDILSKLKGFTNKNTPTNYEHVGENGDVVLTTTNEDDVLEIGMNATLTGAEDEANGSVTLENGVVVTVKDGVIEAIADGETVTEEDMDALILENASLKEQVQNLTAERDDLQNQLSVSNTSLEEATNLITEATETITNLKSQIGSDYAPKNRQGSAVNAPGKPTGTQNAENLKTGAREILDAKKAKNQQFLKPEKK